ncbi:MAG: HD domain-containing protein [Oscillospiraceae bacterium]|nr:HD domain-containing protein [Oscillospiraceae bacterium]
MINLPGAPKRIIDTLEAVGHRAYAVGGCVRDALRGAVPGDWDVASSAKPEEVRQALRGLRLIETGLRHGTLTAIVDGEAIEITSFRLDGAYTDHRRPDTVSFTDDLCADLSRRDFTVNAMAYHPEHGLIDPFNGEADLRAGILRCVGEPEKRFGEDALRILRALRFASVMGFTMEAKTADAILEQRGLLRHVAAERIQKEFTKLLCGQELRRVLMEYRKVVFTLFPPLEPMDGFGQHNPWHCYDVWEHCCAAAEAIRPAPALRYAALLHDAGKPRVFTRGPDGKGHFYGHAVVSEGIAEELLKGLRCPKRLIAHVLQLIRRHELRLLEQASEPKGIPPAALRKLLGEMGEESLLDLLELMRADTAAQAPDKRYRLDAYEPLCAQVREMSGSKACTRLSQLAVNGNDLMAVGLRGPGLGKALDRLLEEVLEGRLENEREALIQYALRYGDYPGRGSKF